MGRHYRITNKTNKRLGFPQEGGKTVFIDPGEVASVSLSPGQVKAAERSVKTGEIDLLLKDERGAEEMTAAPAPEKTVTGATQTETSKPPTSFRIVHGLDGHVTGAVLENGDYAGVLVNVHSDDADRFALVHEAQAEPLGSSDGETSILIDLGEREIPAVIRFEGGALVSLTIGDAELFLADLLVGVVDPSTIAPPAPDKDDEDPLATYSDEQLADLIESKTEKRPHPNSKRPSLEAKAREALGLPPATAKPGATEGESF